MKGLMRIYDERDIFKARLNWVVFTDNILNFYEDKKSRDPSSTLNLSDCKVKKIYNDSFNVNMIEITTSQNQTILINPDNMNDFIQWKEMLYVASQKDQKPEITPRKTSEPRIRSLRNSNPSNRPYNQNALHPSNNVNQHHTDDAKYGPESSNRHMVNGVQAQTKRSSNISVLGGNNLQNLVLERNDGIIKRHSALIINKRSSAKEPRRESDLLEIIRRDRSRAIDTVKEDPMMSDEDVLETKPLEELRKKYPITDKTKRWSIAATDLVGKTNDELFLMLIQLNREKAHMEIWKDTLGKSISEIDTKLKDRLGMQIVKELQNNRKHYEEQLQNIEYLLYLAHPLISFMESVVQMSDAYGGNNDAFHVVYHQCSPTGKEDFSNIEFIRHNQERQVAKLINGAKPGLNTAHDLNRDYGSDKENNPEMLFNLNHSEEFISRKTDLEDVINDISSQLQKYEPSKVDIERYIKDIILKQGSSLQSVNNKTLIKNVKSLKESEIKANPSSSLPKRSTRKAPKSDMAPSISRKEILKSEESIQVRSQSSSLRHLPNQTHNTNANLGRHSFNTPVETDSHMVSARSVPALVTPRSQKSKSSTYNFSDSIPKSKSSKVQNQLRKVMRTEPYSNKRSPSPTYRSRSSILSVQGLESGPLLKISIGLFQNVHGPKRSSARNDGVERNRVSLSEPDISVRSHRMDQRFNLNYQVDDTKQWRNPGSGNYSRISTPEKINLGGRYGSSIITENNSNVPKEKKPRQINTNEKLLNVEDDRRISSLLAQETSRRERPSQNV